MEDWGSNFRKDDETSCEGGGGYYYLVGFERDGTNNLNGIKRAKCCARDQTFWNIPTQCQMPDWIRSLDGWVGCVNIHVSISGWKAMLFLKCFQFSVVDSFQ